MLLKFIVVVFRIQFNYNFFFSALSLRYFQSSFYYVRYRILFKSWQLVLSRQHFTLKLFLIALIFTVVFFLQQLLSLFFKALDELFFFKYRSIQIKAPVFIIANPRSGTTYLHHLMSKDERFAYMKLAYTIFPSVSFAKLYNLIAKMDKHIGNPIKRLLHFFDSKLYKGWDNIHPMGFNKPEEDEALYTLALTSPAVFLLFPFLHKVKENWLLDNEPAAVRKHMMSYYKNCVQRFMYANGRDKIYLSKNVLSSGRINSLLNTFPDAKIIYLIRNPYEALPSFISMFAVMYSVHSPQLKNTDTALKVWAMLGLEFYKNFDRARSRIAEKNLVDLKYENVIEEPVKAIKTIYEKFNFDMSPVYLNTIEAAQSRSKSYKSKHHYSLEQYGLTKAEIDKELPFIN